MKHKANFSVTMVTEQRLNPPKKENEKSKKEKKENKEKAGE